MTAPRSVTGALLPSAIADRWLAWRRYLDALRDKRGEHDAEMAYRTSVAQHDEIAAKVAHELTAPGGLYS